jgi:uncharacterized RDD family membrane protein YckC
VSTDDEAGTEDSGEDASADAQARDVEATVPSPAGLAPRAFARLIDTLLVVVVALAFSAPFAETVTVRSASGELRQVTDLPLAADIAVALLPVVYEVGFVLWRGQTVGKLFGHLRVVKSTGRRADLRAALVRAAVPSALLAAGPLLLPVVAVVYLSAVLLQGRGVVDRLAGTTVAVS